MKPILFNLLVLIVATILPQNANAQDSYNLMRGIELAENEEYDEALTYLQKELDANPKNGEAHMHMGFIYEAQDELGHALSSYNKALKFLSSKSESRYEALLHRAKLYHELDNDDKAQTDLAQLIKENPEYYEAYSERAFLYYLNDQYDLADADYRKMIALDDGNIEGYIGLGLNADEQDKYQEAIKQYDIAIKLSPNYSHAYSYRAESRMALKQWAEAADDVIKAISIDYDDYAIDLLDELADSAYEEITSKLRAQKLKEPNEGVWSYYLARCEENQGQYDAAVEHYKESFAIDGDASSAYAIANCYDELGLYREAAKYCELAIRINPNQRYYSTLLASIKDNAGQPTEAIKILDAVIADNPSYDFAYYRRGWIKDNTGDIEGALEDYSTAIDLDPEYYIHGYLSRGKLWQMKDEQEKATKDFETVIRLDSIPEEAECSFYAYYYIGQREKAIEVLNATLEDGDDGDYYDAACLYSLMGENDQALRICASRSKWVGTILTISAATATLTTSATVKNSKHCSMNTLTLTTGRKKSKLTQMQL